MLADEPDGAAQAPHDRTRPGNSRLRRAAWDNLFACTILAFSHDPRRALAPHAGNRPQRANSAAGNAFLWALVCAPAVFAALLVFRYGVDVPFWDEITIAGLLEDLDRGALTLRGLFGQHNEHRMLVPRVLQLAVARSVGWDTRVLMWLTQVVLLTMMGGCIVLWRRSVTSRAPWALVSLTLVSLVLFSPAQHQNLFWGFQICFYIPPACLLASVILTSSPKTTLGPALAAAAALSTTATFSIFPGLLTWPLAAGAALFRYGLPSRGTMRAWGFWAACAVFTTGIYFFGYEAPSQSPSVLAALRQPFTLLSGIAVCVGNPLSSARSPSRPRWSRAQQSAERSCGCCCVCGAVVTMRNWSGAPVHGWSWGALDC